MSRLLSGLATVLKKIVSPAPAVKAVIGLGLGVGTAGWLGYKSIYNVRNGERAIVFNRIFGIKDRVMEEGTHFVLPWFEWPIVFDVKSTPIVLQTLTGSKDLQMVHIGVRILSLPVVPRIPDLYRQLGRDYAAKVFPSIANEVLKQAVAHYNASQLLTQRNEVSLAIKRELTERARKFNIFLEDVSIVELSFGSEFTSAVERKQVAQQDAERAKFLVVKAIQDKQSAIIKAEGEAKSAEMIGQAIASNPSFLELRRISTAKSIAEAISRSPNSAFLKSDSLMLNLRQKSNYEKKLAEFGAKKT